MTRNFHKNGNVYEPLSTNDFAVGDTLISYQFDRHSAGATATPYRVARILKTRIALIRDDSIAETLIKVFPESGQVQQNPVGGDSWSLGRWNLATTDDPINEALADRVLLGTLSRRADRALKRSNRILFNYAYVSELGDIVNALQAVRDHLVEMDRKDCEKVGTYIATTPTE